ncbi:PepSY-associated TM helix domain-containing protein [Olivibacter domesticus]|uniref:Uncharacterized iron-regulated membrane protein n=1 Tax=Olivibacter domesticus TaxID=407022 RepID=A0A1H7JJH2_OLID1|nr:PepSY-associated TM helix domain-containing protein [Olivibacter domesticus]SEK74516.1 Uncharacterized iron-regulated membrane protein [Olivibacter domesticus]
MLIKKERSVKANKSTFRKVSEWLHLWIGLFSGIIVFVVCLTGGIWVWRYEVWHFTERYQQVAPQKASFLVPSRLIARTGQYLSEKSGKAVNAQSITYGKVNRAAYLSFKLGKDGGALVYVNPYTGEKLKDKREPSPSEKFFIFIRAGHRFFWLPQKIGSPIVGAACILFLITLITGFIWWYPSKWNKKAREKSFKIKWGAKWKRLNIDLHNVLGFYSLLVVMALTISGVVFTFEWFEKAVYSTLTWKQQPAATAETPLSDTLTVGLPKLNHPEDMIFHKINSLYPNGFARLFIGFPERPADTYETYVGFGDGTLIYNMDFRYFDQGSLKELSGTTERTKPYKNLSLGEKIFRMNFDIHTGQIIGLPSKILAFFACIIGAGLPVTGFIIWYNRKWGKKKKNRKIVIL